MNEHFVDMRLELEKRLTTTIILHQHTQGKKVTLLYSLSYRIKQYFVNNDSNCLNLKDNSLS